MNLWKDIHYQRIEDFLDMLNQTLQKDSEALPPEQVDSPTSEEKPTSLPESIPPPSSEKVYEDEQRPPPSDGKREEPEPSEAPETQAPNVSPGEVASSVPTAPTTTNSGKTSSKAFFQNIPWQSPAGAKTEKDTRGATETGETAEETGEEQPSPEPGPPKEPDQNSSRSFFANLPWGDKPTESPQTPPQPVEKGKGESDNTPTEAAPEPIEASSPETKAKSFFGNLNWEGISDSWEALEKAPDRAPPVKVAAQRKALPREEQSGNKNPLSAATRSAMVTSQKLARTREAEEDTNPSNEKSTTNAKSFFQSVQWTKNQS